VILDFIVYTGANTDCEDFELGVSGNVVAHMMKPYYNKGHIVYTDNWYSSPILTEFLHEKDTGLCGTVRKNRKGLPSLDSKLQKGEVQVAHNMIWMALKWQDKKEVYMISSVHELGLINTGKRDYKTGKYRVKPTCIVNYNKNMGGVDQIDKTLSLTETIRKTIKWYKKLFFHVLDIALVNAHALYNRNNPENRLSFPDFRLTIILKILNLEKEKRVSSQISATRLIGTHLPVAMEKRKRCTLCQMRKKRADSKFQCNTCSVTLCITPCFYDYHTNSNLP